MNPGAFVLVVLVIVIVADCVLWTINTGSWLGGLGAAFSVWLATALYRWAEWR